MNEALQILLQALGAAILAALIPIMTIIGRKIGRWLNNKISSIDNDMLRGLAYTGVRWVAQKFPEMDNAQKFQKVYNWIGERLPKVTGDDIEAAIEEAVKTMKEELKGRG